VTAVRPPILKLPPGMRWRASRDGVGHLLPRQTAAVRRYLCNRMPIAERYAWPMTSRCEWCVAKLTEGGR
jgi:hypothetical protein